MKKLIALLILGLISTQTFAGEMGESLDKECKKNVQASRNAASEEVATEQASEEVSVEIVEENKADAKR